MLRCALRAAIAAAIMIALSGCASARISRLIKKLRDNPVRADAAPSDTMKKLAEYGVKAASPIFDALTVDEREFNISLVRTLGLIVEEIEPEEFAELLAHPGRGVGEAAQKIIIDPNIRNLTDKLTSMLRTYDPRTAAEPKHAEPVYRRVLICLGKASHPPAVPALRKAITQPDNKTRAMALLALAEIFDRFPYTVVCRKAFLYKRYYAAAIYFALRSAMMTDTDAEVRHYASRAMEAFTENGYGVFPKSPGERDREREGQIIDAYDTWASARGELRKYPNCPGPVNLARRLGWTVRQGKIIPRNVIPKKRRP